MYQRLLEAAHARAAAHHGAFYSSVLGGIVTEPGLMVLHTDDHMVHRGHGVYDVVPLSGGALYQLHEHIDRLLAAADAAGIPVRLGPAEVKRIVLDTAAASMKLNGAHAWRGGGGGASAVLGHHMLGPGGGRLSPRLPARLLLHLHPPSRLGAAAHSAARVVGAPLRTPRPPGH